MHNELKKIPTELSDDSRVWIFQSSRPFNERETLEINEQLKNFYLQWQTHGEPVKGWGELLFETFVVVIADESASQVSGCSTDGMTRVVKSLERQYSVNFFDRLTISFLHNEKVQMLPLNQISYGLEKGFIETDTPLFNNLVATKGALLKSWLTPLDKSWLWQRIVEKTVS